MELVLGALVSLVAQFIKKQKDFGEWSSLATVFILSLGGAALYTWLSHAGYWEAVRQVLITAGAFYAFVILRFKNASSDSNVIG